MTPRIVSASSEARIDIPGRREKNEQILATRIDSWNNRQDGPRVGDFVILADGTLRRFAYDWGDDIQTTWKSESGSFYIGKSGHASHSGGLEPGISKEKLELTDEVREGHFWFFEGDWSRAHSAVNVTMPCRVYRQK